MAKKNKEIEKIQILQHKQNMQRTREDYTRICKILDKKFHDISFNPLEITLLLEHDRKAKQKWIKESTYIKSLGHSSNFVGFFISLNVIFLVFDYFLGYTGYRVIALITLVSLLAYMFFIFDKAIKLQKKLKNNLIIPTIEKARPGFYKFYKTYQKMD